MRRSSLGEFYKCCSTSCSSIIVRWKKSVDLWTILLPPLITLLCEGTPAYYIVSVCYSANRKIKYMEAGNVTNEDTWFPRVTIEFSSGIVSVVLMSIFWRARRVPTSYPRNGPLEQVGIWASSWALSHQNFPEKWIQKVIITLFDSSEGH